MTDASKKDTGTTTPETGDKDDDAIVQPDSMNPHVVPDSMNPHGTPAKTDESE